MTTPRVTEIAKPMHRVTRDTFNLTPAEQRAAERCAPLNPSTRKAS